MERDIIIDNLLAKYINKWKLPIEELSKDIEGVKEVEDRDIFITAFQIEWKEVKRITSEVKFAKMAQYSGGIIFLITLSVAIVTYIYAEMNGYFLLIYGPIVLGITMYYQNRTKAKVGKELLKELQENRKEYWNE